MTGAGTVGLQYRRSRRLGSGARLNVSGSGLSVSQRIGPLTVGSRGSMSLRLGRGLSYRFGRRNGLAPLLLVGLLLWWLVRVGVVLLWRAGVVGLWCLRWVGVRMGDVFLARRHATQTEGTQTGIPAGGSPTPSQTPAAPEGAGPGLEITRPRRTTTPPQ
jgi:hypothetical protein